MEEKILDKNGKEIKIGMKLVDDNHNRPHTVIYGDFEKHIWGEGDDLIADGGFIKTLLTPERGRRYEIIEG